MPSGWRSARRRPSPKIPVLPISYADALPLLVGAEGARWRRQSWRGALPITYHVGPGPAQGASAGAFNWDLKPVYDVIATMHGSAAAEQWVIRGNHHDAWVNGADDPVSGRSAVLEEARVLGELHKQGWTPARTIIYCAWDGEEPGLLGSTEWVETHREELRRAMPSPTSTRTATGADFSTPLALRTWRN